MIEQLQTKLRRLLFEEVPGKDKPFKTRMIKVLRVAYYSFKDYNQDFLLVRASALTYFSILSLVPLLAMAFGIAQGFGLESYLEKQILENFQSQQEIMVRLLEFSHSMLENTSGGVVAGVGAIILIWAVMRLLTNIEESFNAIWKVKHSRPLIRKFTDYISMMILAPIFVIVSSSGTIYLEVFINQLTSEYEGLGFLGSIYLLLINLLPYVSVWILFTLLYLVMPNTKVKFQYAILSGVLVGSLYQFVQYLYIHFQVGVSQYNTIYGSFAAFPLFLIWLQLSWLIILLGVEITYYSQNVDQFDVKERTRQISERHKKILSLLIMKSIVSRFKEAASPYNAKDLSTSLNIPINMTKDLISDLVEVNLISEIHHAGEEFEPTLQPAIDTSHLTVMYVLKRLDALNGEDWSNDGIQNADIMEQHISDMEHYLTESNFNRNVALLG